jgi:hypothetical protein
MVRPYATKGVLGLSVAWHEALRPCFKQVTLFFETMSFCEVYAGKKALKHGKKPHSDTDLRGSFHTIKGRVQIPQNTEGNL